jgi:1,2-diacylglycerol-3-alpha-glucose alpha-1,2-galactosyltransferase
MMKVHIVSETAFYAKGMGVHTAFIDSVNLLRKHNNVEVVINNEGHGDVFHAHTYGFYYFWKGWRYKGKRIHTVHTTPETLEGSIPFYKLVKPFAKMFFKMVYNFADVCIVISPTVKKSLEDLNVKSKLVYINNPIIMSSWTNSTAKKASIRQGLGIGETDFVVLGVGQLQKRKGVEDFIDMAIKMPHLKFIWVGGRPFGNATEGINRINARINAAPANIQFTGLIPLEDMSNYYAAADAFVFPSYQENCPLAPIEAAAMGLPVIFRNLKEYETLYESPYLKAQSNEAFMAQLDKLFSQKDFYNEAVTLSKNLIKQFEENSIYQKTMDVYQQLAEQGKTWSIEAIEFT